MHHAAAEDLDPAFALAEWTALAAALKAADINFAAGLRKGEVVGTQTDFCILAVQTLGKGLQRAFQVCHGNALVYHQTLDLVEQGRVGGIYRVGAEYTARGNDSNGGLRFFHYTDLYRRSLGSQYDIVIDIKGVLGVSGRVVFGDVQCLKVVVVVLHLRALGNVKAHAHKDVLDFVQNDGQRVLVADLGQGAGHGHIQGFLSQPLLLGCLFDLCGLVGDGVLNVLANFVCQLADHRALLSRQLAHLLQNSGQLALFAQVLNTGFFQLFGAVKGGQCFFGGPADLFQLCFHLRILSFILYCSRQCANKKRLAPFV